MENLLFRAEQMKNQLDAMRPIDDILMNKIMQKFRLDWNYHSNHIEGNSLTYGETKALLLHNITAQGKPLKDHIEITGHNEAINWILDVVRGNEYPLTENFIRELHTLLLKEPYEVDAITPDGKPTKRKIEIGKYKSTPNHVKTKTGEIFYFASVEETPAKMHDLVAEYTKEQSKEDKNPIILAAKFHYDFIRIHPFDDGNGRTARILMNFILMQHGYPPVVIKTEDKQNYFAALQLADAGQINPFIEYITKNLIHSLELMISGAKGENIEEDDDVEKELFFLEKKLKNIDSFAEVLKSGEAIKSIFNNSIVELYEGLKTQTSSFNNFYARISYSICMDRNYIPNNIDYFSFINKNINDSTDSLMFEIHYNSLRDIRADDFYQGFRIEFKFDKVKYSVMINGGTPIINSYSYILSKEDVEKIINKEKKRHTELLTQKINELEKNK